MIGGNSHIIGRMLDVAENGILADARTVEIVSASLASVLSANIDKHLVDSTLASLRAAKTFPVGTRAAQW